MTFQITKISGISVPSQMKALREQMLQQLMAGGNQSSINQATDPHTSPDASSSPDSLQTTAGPSSVGGTNGSSGGENIWESIFAQIAQHVKGVLLDSTASPSSGAIAQDPAFQPFTGQTQASARNV